MDQAEDARVLNNITHSLCATELHINTINTDISQ